MARESGDPAVAVRLLAGSAAMRRRFEWPAARPHLEPEYDDLLASARAVLGDAAFAAAWADSEDVELEDFATLLDEVSRPAGPSS